jgi:hypothetical protein
MFEVTEERRFPCVMNDLDDFPVTQEFTIQRCAVCESRTSVKVGVKRPRYLTGRPMLR